MPNKTENEISKKEYFAGLAMQGMIVNAGRNGYSISKPNKIVEDSILIADLMLKKINDGSI